MDGLYRKTLFKYIKMGWFGGTPIFGNTHRLAQRKPFHSNSHPFVKGWLIHQGTPDSARTISRTSERSRWGWNGSRVTSNGKKTTGSLPYLKLTVRTWKWMVGNSRFLLGWPIFRGELLVSGSVGVFEGDDTTQLYGEFNASIHVLLRTTKVGSMFL